ncbi:recombinase family protein [Amycolatopsis pittospori]|uniref:recombinase family protein n=1 Tax=Amycolatopsis pittospori TaxID=2749434 RepID=UPI0015F0A2BC
MYDILRNPKYTGYQVFNRRATRSRRGKVNDPIKWAWSPAPVHEPLIPKWMCDAINAGWKSNQGSRDGTEPTNNTRPRPGRTSSVDGCSTNAEDGCSAIRVMAGRTTAAGEQQQPRPFRQVRRP